MKNAPMAISKIPVPAPCVILSAPYVKAVVPTAKNALRDTI